MNSFNLFVQKWVEDSIQLMAKIKPQNPIKDLNIRLQYTTIKLLVPDRDDKI